MAVASDPTSGHVTRSANDVDATRSSGLWALFLGLGLLMIGNGLNGAVIGIRSVNEGFSITVTGVIMAGYFAGFLLAPRLVVRMIPSVGHIRVFAGLASTASSAVLVHAMAVWPVTWTMMRFVFGFCVAGLYIVIESWLNEMSSPANRGRTMATYMIVSMGGLAIGQFMITVADPNGFRLFVVSSVLVSMSLVPVTLVATTKAPVVTVPDRVTVRELIGIVPTGVLGSFMSGASAGVLLGLSAVYAAGIGLSLERTGFFLVAPMIGAIIFQWPIGRLSDRVSRRLVIFGVALAAMLICAALVVTPQHSVAVPVLMVALGGTMFPLYSLVVSYTIDWTPDGKTIGASGTLIGINGSGALLGPLIAAPLMSHFGARWFFWTLMMAFAVIVGYLGWRIAVKEALPIERQKSFVPFPARAGAFAIQLVVKPVRKATKIATGKQVVSRRHAHQAGLDAARHPASRAPEPAEIYDSPAAATHGLADPHEMRSDSPVSGP